MTPWKRRAYSTYIHIFIYTYIHIYICIRSHIHIYIRSHIHVYIRSQIHIHICSHICIYIHMFIYTCKHTFTYTYIHINTCLWNVDVCTSKFEVWGLGFKWRALSGRSWDRQNVVRIVYWKTIPPLYQSM